MKIPKPIVPSLNPSCPQCNEPSTTPNAKFCARCGSSFEHGKLADGPIISGDIPIPPEEVRALDTRDAINIRHNDPTDPMSQKPQKPEGQ